MSIQIKKLSDLTPDPENANAGTDRGGAVLDKSLRDLGAGRSILVDKNGVIIAGNKTAEHAQKVGMDNVLVVPVTGDTIVAVQRMDLDLLTDPKARELAYADNRTAELNLNWDVERIVRDVEKGIDLSGYFHDDEVQRLVDGVKDEEGGKSKSGGDSEGIPLMEVQPFEHYDYLFVVFRNTFDWTAIVELLGLEKAAVDIGEGRRKVGLCRVVDGGALLKRLKGE